MDQSVFSLVVGIVKETGNSIIANIYNSIGDLYSNSISYTLLGLSITIWAFLKIKGDGFNRDDIFKAMLWLSVFLIVKVTLSSFETYKGFLSIFQLPYKWASAGVSAYGSTGNASDLVNHFWNIISNKSEEYAEVIKWKNIAGWFILGVFILVNGIMTIAIVVMTILSQLMATILLSFCALVLPLLCWSQTRSIFVGWLKLYIGMSLWAPLSILVSGLPQSALNAISNLETASNDNTSLLLIPTVIAIFALFLLSKIPAWVSAIIGSADSSGGGSGLAGLASAGGFAFKRVMEGVKEGGKSFSENKSLSHSLGSALGTIAGGKIGGAIGGNTANQVAKAGQFIAKATPHFKGK